MWHINEPAKALGTSNRNSWLVSRQNKRWSTCQNSPGFGGHYKSICVSSVLHKPCCGDKVALTVDVWLCPLCWSDGVQGVAGDASHVSTVQQFVPVKVIASTRLSDVLRLSGGILKCCLLCFMYQRRIKTERGRLSTHPTPVRTVSGKDNIRGRMRSFLHVKCVFLFTVVHHQEEINFFHPQSLKDSTVYNTHTMFKLIMFSKCDISLKLWTGRRTFHLKYTYIRYNVADWVYPGRW